MHATGAGSTPAEMLQKAVLESKCDACKKVEEEGEAL